MLLVEEGVVPGLPPCAPLPCRALLPWICRHEGAVGAFTAHAGMQPGRQDRRARVCAEVPARSGETQAAGRRRGHGVWGGHGPRGPEAGGDVLVAAGWADETRHRGACRRLGH
ncbi:hypothetical protein AAFF_G00264950 [Aldrovandia affinis]|uniref:Uncharacterized protein n=1 Tax=Aldrovandia affinis TaxID=143900 RepID=A0AAD7RBR8_9TELE|nr:hypothetical protein AAFF_G00264950 [Aldrovandia affinis]